MREIQYSSIMDYGSRFSSDLAGLGSYDSAAIAFGYGGLVYAFEQGAPDEPLLEIQNFQRYEDNRCQSVVGRGG